MAHGCMRRAHECITHGCVAQGAPEGWAVRSWRVLGVPEVHDTWVHQEHMSALHMGVWPRVPGAGSKIGVYLEYLKLCLKLYRKLSIHLTHIPDLLIEQ